MGAFDNVSDTDENAVRYEKSKVVAKTCRSCGISISVPAHFDNLCFKCDLKRCGCKSERVLLGLKERLRNEQDNVPWWLESSAYMDAIKDVIKIIEKLEDTK
jgi:hypothetical protein